ncbi:methyltransferase, FxLD system [Embleya sp. NPDC020630]|uniref:methyltransferase, FxLD system n=1 Tax=Embleya sp. NPDC020630 TaxID=3363979 RepID=UPI0037BB9C51
MPNLPETDPRSTPTPESLRAALVDTLVRDFATLKMPLSPEVVDAFGAVPRHLFLPDVAPERAYAYDAVVTKRAENGSAMSSVSAPQIIAMMLMLLDLKPGHRVLEIGSGGYNALLMRELVGPDGEVTTIDIDADVTDRAKRGLTAAGVTDVNVLTGDGGLGAPEFAPFDRIVVTVGAPDIAAPWDDQLAEDGRIVLPLDLRGLTRAVAFEREAGHLSSRGYGVCGFVPMQGVGAHAKRLILLHDQDVALRVDDDMAVDAEPLRKALLEPRVERWTGVTVGAMEPFDQLDLWLASVASGFCLLTADREAVDRGLVTPSWRLGTPALVDGDSFAYRARARPVDPEETVYEFGVYGHGPAADTVAETLAEHIRTWDREHRSGPGARIEAYPVDTADADLPAGRVIDKRNTRVTISWP